MHTIYSVCDGPGGQHLRIKLQFHVHCREIYFSSYYICLLLYIHTHFSPPYWLNNGGYHFLLHWLVVVEIAAFISPLSRSFQILAFTTLRTSVLLLFFVIAGRTLFSVYSNCGHNHKKVLGNQELYSFRFRIKSTVLGVVQPDKNCSLPKSRHALRLAV